LNASNASNASATASSVTAKRNFLERILPAEVLISSAIQIEKGSAGLRPAPFGVSPNYQDANVHPNTCSTQFIYGFVSLHCLTPPMPV
jgi:hypothetical protein